VAQTLPQQEKPNTENISLKLGINCGVKVRTQDLYSKTMLNNQFPQNPINKKYIGRQRLTGDYPLYLDKFNSQIRKK